MKTSSCAKAAKCAALLLIFTPQMSELAARSQELSAARPNPPQARRGQDGTPARGIYKARVQPHWFPDNTRFWYRNDLSGGAKHFIMVDAGHGIRREAFDHEKLAAALSKAVSQDYKADHLPFELIEFTEDGRAIRFTAADKHWKCDLTTYECAETKDGSAGVAPPANNVGQTILSAHSIPAERRERASFADELESAIMPASPQEQEPSQPNGRTRRGTSQRQSKKSPDGHWTALLKDFNVYLRAENDEKEFQLTQDGVETNAYGRLEWAPDSKALVGWRIEPGENKEVYLIRSSPAGGGRARLESRPYPQAGDKFIAYELSLFDVENRKQIKPEVERIDFNSPALRWNKDGRHFTCEKVDRGHQRFRVIEIDSLTGSARNIIDEQSKTFIWTAHTEGVHLNFVNYLEKTPEIIRASEQDGWRHLYLVDASAGAAKNQITKGPWVVRGIDKIDEDTRQIWFNASGMNPDEDPYFLQFYRVNFDGAGLVALTEGNGNHSVAYSPDRKYLIDTFSRVDLPPVNNLRRASDGGLVCKLEEADISELKAAGWTPPEVLMAKGRDGKTDIWGIICRPKDFDPAKKYPVIENIYAGPQDSFVPKSFSATRFYSDVTDLGFVVVKIDGMGTANRSKAFHDVCWRNLKDGGFVDRILWMKNAAAARPYMDLGRVGVYGTSAGGQSAAGAVLFHPEFYKVAVAACGCHDNRLDKSSWNEQFMGYPVGPWYSECSNIDNAKRLQGKLFLIVGEMDHNVPPESTLRFVDALIKAGKDFDFLEVPNADHGMGGAYGARRMRDFLVHALLGTEPPPRNLSSSDAN